MAKDKDILQRFGANLAESMGAGRPPSPATPPPSAMGKHDGVSRLRAAAEIEVGRIVADPEQPRTEFDAEAIARLAESLRIHGQIQPISVRWSEDMGRYLIVTGERRWRASILAGRPTIAAIILEGERTDSQVLEMQLWKWALSFDPPWAPNFDPPWSSEWPLGAGAADPSQSAFRPFFAFIDSRNR